jgi:hypothetical protein
MAISVAKKAGAINANSTAVAPCRAQQKRDIVLARRRRYFASLRDMVSVSDFTSGPDARGIGSIAFANN